MAKRVIDDSTLTPIADKIREHLGGTDLIKPSEFADKIDFIAEDKYTLGVTDGYTNGYTEGETAGIEQGKQTQYGEFWDNYQNNGANMNYQYAFYSSKWNNINFKPKHRIFPSNAMCMFESCGCTNMDFTQLGVAFTWEWCSSFQSTFKNFKGLVNAGYLNMTTYNSNCDQMFYNCTGLTTVKILSHDAINYYNNAFYNCTALTDLTITGTIGKLINLKWSPLNKASITSVINALSSTTSGLTATFNLAAVNTAFETSEGAADGSTTEEWAALVATKVNWTISLV